MHWNPAVYVTAALLLATAVAGCMGADVSLEGDAVQIVDAPDEVATNQPIEVSWSVAGEGDTEQDEDDVSVGGNASAGNASAGGNASVDDSADEEGGEEIRTGLVWGYESVSEPQSPGDYENEAANETGTTGETFSASFMADEPGTVYLSAWAEADGAFVFSSEHTVEVTAAGNATGNGTIGGNGTAANNTTAADHTVTISSALIGYLSSYDPEELTVNVGESVVWVNEDDVVHTATADDGSWDTGDIDADNQSEPIVFDTAGEYDYSCTYHGMTMSGTITVEEAPGGNNTTSFEV